MKNIAYRKTVGEKSIDQLFESGQQKMEFISWIKTYIGIYSSLTNILKLVDGIPYMPISYFAEAFDLEVKDLGNGIFAIGRYGISTDAALAAAANLW